MIIIIIIIKDLSANFLLLVGTAKDLRYSGIEKQYSKIIKLSMKMMKFP